MQKIINKKYYDEAVNYQILGTEKQTLQIVLMPSQSIISRKDAIIYTSDNISQNHTVKSRLKRCLQMITMNRSEICIELKNESSGVGYVGLQVMKGRVIIIDNETNEKMVVKEKYVLAKTPNIDLKYYGYAAWNGPENKHHNLKQIIAKKKQTPINNNATATESLNQVSQKPLADQFQDLDRESKQLVFLQSQSNFIEKMLGANEKIKLRPECVVAFSPTVSVQRELGNGFIQMLSTKSKFITITGPGLIYIDMQVGNRFFRRDQLSLYVVVIYFFLYFLMFLIVTFERRFIERP